MAYPKTCHDAECRLATGHSYEGTAPPICAGEKQKDTLRCLRRSGRERRPTSKFRHSSRKNINLQFLQTQAQEADYHIEELLGPQNQTDLLLHIDPGSSKCLNQGETVRDGKPTAAFPVCLPRKDHFSATICMPVDWNGQWECREIQIDEDAGNCNNRNHKGISDLKFCLLDDLCDGGGLLQPNIPVWSLCENLDQQCSFYSKVQMSVEKLFALYLFHLIKYARDCVESCATRQKVEIPSIDLCRITLAVPIMKSEKEERLRCALSEASDRIGIDNRCVRLAHEPKSACYAVVRGIETGLTSNEGNDSLHLELRDSDELIVVDVGGCTTDICRAQYEKKDTLRRYLIQDSTSLPNGNRLVRSATVEKLCRTVAKDQKIEISEALNAIPHGRFYKLDSVENVPGNDDTVRRVVIQVAEDFYEQTVSVVKSMCEQPGRGVVRENR